MSSTNLEDLESEAYQESFSDGLMDLAVGLALAVIGAIWLWFEGQAGLAGAVGALVAWALVPIRRRVVEPRLGYVRWTAPRLKWERSQLKLLFWLGTVALLSGIALAQAMGDADRAAVSDRNFVAGLPAILLAVGAFVLAATSGFRRLWFYGVALIGAGVVTIIIEAGPGGSLFTAGTAIGAFSVALLVRFLRAHPVRT